MKKAFTKPSEQEIITYLTETKNYETEAATLFAAKFWNWYESVGWKVGKKQMVSWHAAIRTWELNNKNQANGNQFAGSTKTINGRGSYQPTGTGGY